MNVEGKLEGHDAELLRIDGERAFVLCAIPFAPGKPAVLVLATEPVLSIQTKTVGSKRQPDGRYLVEGRIVMLRREERAQLVALGAKI